MPGDRHAVKFWRGSRQAYNALGTQGALDFWTRYSVKESDGRRTEYFGSKPVMEPTGELYPVLDIVTSLPSTLNVGDRYLVGQNATYDTNGTKLTDAEYYVVDIAADLTQSQISTLGKHCVRVASKHYWRYQIVNGELISYDHVIDGGTY